MQILTDLTAFTPSMLAAAALALCPSAQAAQFSVDKEITSSLQNAAGETLVDLDGDGDLDVVVAARFDDPFEAAPAIVENLGGGVFAPARRLEGRAITGTAPSGPVGAGDVDGDGDIDLVTADANLQLVYLYRSTGGLNWDLEAPVPGSRSASSPLVLNDVDGDGDLDLIQTDTQVGAFLQLYTAGAFAPPQQISAIPSRSYILAMDDVDGDGHDDIVTFEGGPPPDTVWWYRSSGAGTFSPGVPVTQAVQSPVQAAVTDVDSDGLNDIVVSAFSSSSIGWFKNNGGSFGLRTVIAQTFVQPGSRLDEFALTDVDQDGIRDLVYAQTAPSQLLWVQGLGGGAFSTTPRAAAPTSINQGSLSAVGDVDGGGAEDLLVRSSPLGLSINFHRPGSEPFREGLPLTERYLCCAFPDIDVDQDGDPDVFVQGNHASVDLLENLGGGNYAPGRTLAQLGANHELVGVVDMDGDGELDLVAQAPLPWAYRIFKGLGNGTFDTSPVAIFAGVGMGAHPDLPEPIDLDGDGDRDLLVTVGSGLSYGFGVLENLGGLTFAPVVVLNPAAHPHDPRFADLDGDGQLDLIYTENNTTTLLWQRGGPGLTVAPPVPISGVPQDTWSALPVDLDLDGHLDLVCVTGPRGEVKWSLGNGDGTFAGVSGATSADVCNAKTPIAADLDNDGDPDIIACVYFSEDDQYFENVGGTLLPPVILPRNRGYARIIDPVDVDGDGDLDLFHSEFGTRLLGWKEVSLVPTIGDRSCFASPPNSTGDGAQLFASGALLAATDELDLRVRDLPRGAFCMAVTSRTLSSPMPIANSVGQLCLGGAIGRFQRPGQIVAASSSGTALVELGTMSLATPQGLVAAIPGERWSFQVWYRDLGTSNLTNVATVQFQ